MASSTAQALDSPEGDCLHATAKEKGKNIDSCERDSNSSLTLRRSDFETQSQKQNIDVLETFGVHGQRMQIGPSSEHPHRDYDNIHGRGTAIAPAYRNSPLLRDLYMDLNFWINGVTRELGREDLNSLPLSINSTELIASDSAEPTISQIVPESSSASPRGRAGSMSNPPRFLVLDPEDSGDDVQGGHASDDSSDGYDSMPDLISISDSEDDRDRFRDWDWDADSDDAMSMPDLEPVTDDDVRLDLWTRRSIDESLLDSDEEEEARAHWAEVDRTFLPATSDSSSSSSESELSANESEEATDSNSDTSIRKMRHLTRRRRNARGLRTRRPHTTTSSPPSDPELPMRRVTSLDEAGYANVQISLEDALDARALAREWPIRSGDLASWWYQPIPLADSLARRLTTNLDRERASWRFYSPLLNQNELNWRPFLLSDLDTREADGDSGESTVGSSTNHAAPVDATGAQ